MPAMPEITLDGDGPTIDPSAPQPENRSSLIATLFVGMILLVVAYLGSVRVAENAFGLEFRERVNRAILVTDFGTPVSQQMGERIRGAVDESRWVTWGGVRATVLVLAKDEQTWLYVDGYAERPTEGLAPDDLLTEWMSYLPARAEVSTTLPHTAPLSISMLMGYALVLLLVLFVQQRRTANVENARLTEAMAARAAAAQRAGEIEAELALTRRRLTEIEPKERKHSDEIDHLQREREELHRQLNSLASREESLRGRADRAVDLAQEVRALEDLLEEATGDLDTKSGEIDRLEVSLKKATKSSGKAQNAKRKSAELLGKRFRTLYKTIEIDDRAIDDILGLGDEALRLKAEECLKRLADDADNVAVRRKVGGLPEHVQAFELGFAGKGRIYYARGKSRRFRVLCVGAKNTQAADLDYLARLPREVFS